MKLIMLLNRNNCSRFAAGARVVLRLLPAMFTLLTGSALGGACGGTGSGTADGTTATPSIFSVSVGDLSGFGSWEHFSFTSTGTPDKMTHVAGARTVYLNHRPPKGSTTFPVGTVIVKTILPDMPQAKTFAMAKHGGNYNTGGAPGWEWLELDPTRPDTAPAILWFGVAPPSGENYSGSATGTCNDCHGAARSNDCVLSAPLQLDRL